MPNCELCGEPMQEAERMFKYHGSLGPCPKPPLPRPRVVMVEYIFWDREDGFWLEIEVDRKPYDRIHFDTPEERQRAHDDLMVMMRSKGAQDVPAAMQ